MTYYQLSCGWYHPLETVPALLCTPDLAQAVRLLAQLQQQGYDWCALGVSTVPIGGAYARTG